VMLQTSGENLLNLIAAADELELLNLAECKLYDHVLDITCRNPYSLLDSNDFPLLNIVAMICLLKRDDLGLEEIEIWNYLIKWGIANSKKLLDKNITKWSDEDISSWSDDQFMALKETISQCIPLIRYYHIPKSYIDEQIKQYRLDPNAFIIVRQNDKAIWSDKYHGSCFGNFDLCMQSYHWTSKRTDYYCKITNLCQFTVKEYEVLAFEDFNSRESVALKRIQELASYC
ncbi:3116_t:CDS:2, partial [Racocetra persica]